MINEIKIEGTICGKERPQLRTFPSGDLYFRFSLMWLGQINGRNSKSFFTIVLHGADAEKFDQANAWKQGQPVYVEGFINSWR